MATSEELSQHLSGRYTVERELGRGGMATVYLATDHKHKRQVALKVLHPDLAASIGKERFVREIEIVAGLTHPHILPLHDSGSAGDHLYYVMPFIDGETLRNRLNRERRLPIDDAIQIAAEVADALQAAHEQAIIHRDIKPENILLSRGHALIVDFGIAHLASHEQEGLTETGLVVGTPAYMSPEQAVGEIDLDPRSDIYALGCVLFEMLTGRPPFDDTRPQAVIGKHVVMAPPSLRDVRPDTPAGLTALVSTALAKAPTDRFQSAGSLLESLHAVISGAAAGTRVSEDETGPNVGVIVSKLCNRWRQVNAFDVFLRTSNAERPGTPLLCVVHGEEGNGHGSLVDRLLYTRIHDFANATAGEAGAIVKRVSVPWPHGPDRDILERDLAIALFRELEPSYMGADFSPASLASLATVDASAVIVVEHAVRAKHWSSAERALLSWYVQHFLSALGETSPHAQFIVFVNLVFDSHPTGLSLTPSYLRRRARRRVRDDVEATLDGLPDGCACIILDELAPITVDDVKDWFAKNRVYDSDLKRAQLTESIFAGSSAKPLTLVEAALAEIHQAFVAEQAAQRGSYS